MYFKPNQVNNKPLKHTMMPKHFILFLIVGCTFHLHVHAQCEHITQPTKQEINEGYAQMSPNFIRTVLTLFLKDRPPVPGRFTSDQVFPRFIDHKRLTKPGGNFYGYKLFHDTPSCLEGTLPAKKKTAKLILREAKRLGAVYIDSRNEEQTLERITVVRPNYSDRILITKPDNINDFFEPIQFAYLILGIPRKGGPYSTDHYLDRRDIYPSSWTMRVTEVSEQSIAYYDVMLHKIERNKWAILDVKKIASYHFDFPLK